MALALAARIVLATALAFAALFKLRDRGNVERQMADLLGARAGAPAARVVPAVEAVLAVLLVCWWVPVPGIAAAIVLGAFTIVVVRAQVRHVPCPCFGASTARAAGPASVVRNGVLIAEAVLATGDPRGASALATILWVAVLGTLTLLVVRAS